MTATVPWQPHCLPDGLVYEVLEHHHRDDQALTVGYVAVVVCAQDDCARLAPQSAPLVLARVLFAAAVRPARRAVR
jgi:hypothetical protein